MHILIVLLSGSTVSAATAVDTIAAGPADPEVDPEPSRSGATDFAILVSAALTA